MILCGLAAATMATGLALAAPAAHAQNRGDAKVRPAPAPSRLQLPDGFRPEGIATGPDNKAYVSSLADGDIFALDLGDGRGSVLSQGPGTSSTGLKVDQDRLFVSGGSGGDARIVSLGTGKMLRSFALATDRGPAFINDVIVTADAAWFTDSLDNALYRIALASDGQGRHLLPSQADVAKIDLTGAWVQGAGTNANGITTTPDGTALLVVNSSNGLLYRVGFDGVATQVDLGGYVITNGDGLLREGQTLYAVQNRLNKVAVFTLDGTGASGELSNTLTSPDFDVPTTIARSGNKLYLPNARFTSRISPKTPYWATAITG